MGVLLKECVTTGLKWSLGRRVYLENKRQGRQIWIKDKVLLLS